MILLLEYRWLNSNQNRHMKKGLPLSEIAPSCIRSVPIIGTLLAFWILLYLGIAGRTYPASSRNPGVGHSQKSPRRSNSGHRKCISLCSLPVTFIFPCCNIPLLWTCRFIRNRHQQLPACQHRIQILPCKVLNIFVSAMLGNFYFAVGF